jgi:hypothetical protein
VSQQRPRLGPTPGREQGATGRAWSGPLPILSGVARVPGDEALACQPEGVARCRREQPVNLCRGTPPRAGSLAGVCRGHVAPPRTFPPVVDAEGQSGAALTHSDTPDPPQLAIDSKASHGTLPHRAASRHRLRLGPSCRSPRARRPRRADKPLAAPS